jgi:DNA-binding NtrC family response regulator
LGVFKERPADFDLVITDQVMFDLSGTELMREMAGSRKNIPAILMSGFVDRLPQEDAAGLRIQAVLTKPVDIETMSRAVRAALDRKS